MALSDSMFLFEFVVEKLTSYINCKQFNIKCDFADVFSLDLNDPNAATVAVHKKKPKRKKVRGSNPQIKTIMEPKVQTGQSILLANNFHTMMMNMRNVPIELSLYNKDKPQEKLGSTHIWWSQKYIHYLHDSRQNLAPAPIIVVEEYNVFDELTSKRMATLKLQTKFIYLHDRVTTQYRSLSNNIPEQFNTFNSTGFNTEPCTTISDSRAYKGMAGQESINLNDRFETGIIKTIYSGNRKKSTKRINKRSKSVEDKIKKPTCIKASTEVEKEEKPEKPHPVRKEMINRALKVDLVTSEISIPKKSQLAVIKSKSNSSILPENEFQTFKQLNPLNYIFGSPNGPYGNKVYCVGYFTVENDNKSGESLNRQSRSSIVPQSSGTEPSNSKYKFRLCDAECTKKAADTDTCSQSFCSIDLPANAGHLITVKKCKDVVCDHRPHRVLPPPPDDRILLDLKSIKTPCCDVTQKIEEVMGVEEVTGQIQTKMTLGADPCYCSCECRFGFTKRTTYCKVCGGFEKIGEELSGKGGQLPFPCPVFHKLMDKSQSGSDSKKTDKKKSSAKGTESEKDKKGKKKKKDDRFKFNYGYEGIPPQIGHSHCVMPCTGTLGAVPKNMGWLWTAEDVPGIKFRPMWKPGAANKHVVRLLRMARNPGEVITKKRKKDGIKKRPLKRPLLVVQKKDGEYTVTMETMKAYNKPRSPNQHPYEDKPVLTYTVGRTEEENRERQKRKERAQRRLERAQRSFIQSAFKDMCREICLKTYQQALGLLPDAEDPQCPCYPAEPDATRVNMDLSCSCSEDSKSIGSDTDNDEWIVEFTPPNATFDPTFKPKKVVKVDNTSQYTYLDYRVKLLDRFGNPVPRFFKGPDGRQQCSDLGGFWSADHKWLEINVDGYVAPDGRWAPMAFIGPNGESVDAEEGKFQAANGEWLIVGMDGYIDCQGRWRFYPKSKRPAQKKSPDKKKKGVPDKKGEKAPMIGPSETTFSCFGDVTPRDLSRIGIVGHGRDKKVLLAALKALLARGEKVRLPEPSVVPRSPTRKGRKARVRSPDFSLFPETKTCQHSIPSDKGIIAVDAHGNKKYFRTKEYHSKRPQERLADLTKQGIDLSSFHLPCFHSFINGEVLKQQQRNKYTARKCVSTQA